MRHCVNRDGTMLICASEQKSLEDMTPLRKTRFCQFSTVLQEKEEISCSCPPCAPAFISKGQRTGSSDDFSKPGPHCRAKPDCRECTHMCCICFFGEDELNFIFILHFISLTGELYHHHQVLPPTDSGTYCAISVLLAERLQYKAWQTAVGRGTLRI